MPAHQVRRVADENRDPETGRYTARFSDEELLAFVASQEPIGTGDIADEFDCSQPAAYKRLQTLEESGDVASRMIGGNRVWMLPD